MKSRIQKVDHGDTDKPREPEDDEFARAMEGVRRLRPDPRGERVAPRPPVAGEVGPADSVARNVSPADSVAPDVRPASESDSSYVAPGIDRRELRKLRRGEYHPGDSLDLHGMTATDAVKRVQHFIACSHHRYRCVSIVHGRGLHSEGNVSILRARVRTTLRGNPAVLAFTDAPPSDGGTGAVYVLLRR